MMFILCICVNGLVFDDSRRSGRKMNEVLVGGQLNKKREVVD